MARRCLSHRRAVPSLVGECASPFRHIYASKYTSFFIDLQALCRSISALSKSRMRLKAAPGSPGGTQRPRLWAAPLAAPAREVDSAVIVRGFLNPLPALQLDSKKINSILWEYTNIDLCHHNKKDRKHTSHVYIYSSFFTG